MSIQSQRAFSREENKESYSNHRGQINSLSEGDILALHFRTSCLATEYRLGIR
ncbi:hypothetical protein TSUD_130380, partial [Trifolium subterraneum]